STLPPAAAAASAATSDSSRLRFGPVSTAETASATQTAAISSTRLDMRSLPVAGQQLHRVRDRDAAQREPQLAGEESASRQQLAAREIPRMALLELAESEPLELGSHPARPLAGTHALVLEGVGDLGGDRLAQRMVCGVLAHVPARAGTAHTAAVGFQQAGCDL